MLQYQNSISKINKYSNKLLNENFSSIKPTFFNILYYLLLEKEYSN